MSIARTKLLNEVKELDAVASSTVAQGGGLPLDPGVSVLRRGAAIAGLVVLESFIRDRTEEVLKELQQWPARYQDFPKRFRERATIDALPHIEKFARMRKRGGEDYERELFAELQRIVAVSPPAFQFTRFVAGDYTGNLSVESAKELLGVFQVKDCWASMHRLSVDVGFGVPSVEEELKAIVGRRHRSAHAAGYTPTAGDVEELPRTVRLIGICIDAALSAAIHVALNNWRKWVATDFNWRDQLEIYFVVPNGSRFRVIKKGATRAIRIVDGTGQAKACLPAKSVSITRLLVERSGDGRPTTWDMA